MCTMLATVIGAAGTLMQGMAANSAAKAQAAAANQNARIAEAQAHDAIERGGQEELRLRRQMAQLQGTQRSALAASGMDIDSGSALDVQDASMREGEQDAVAIRFNAAREGWGHQVQAANYRNEASAARAAGRNALFGSIVGAGTSLLSAAGPGTWTKNTTSGVKAVSGRVKAVSGTVLPRYIGRKRGVYVP